MSRVAARDDAGAAPGPARSTIVELDEFWSEGDPRRVEHRAAKLDRLVARPRDELRLALVLADAHAWAEARGPSVHVEHVETIRFPGSARPIVSLGTLIAAIELQRPRAVLAAATPLAWAALRVATLRLDPRPLVILRWVEHAQLERWAAPLRRLDLARRVDVVLVDDDHAAAQARAFGLDRLVLAPLGGPERELDRLVEILAWARAKRRISAGLHDRLPPP